MGRRPIILVVAVLAVLLAGAAGVYAYDHAQKDTIAKGIRVAGIPIGGLEADAAQARLAGQYVARLRKPIVVRYGSHRFRLSAKRAHVAADVRATVQDALARTRDGGLLSRAARELTGGRMHADLQPRVTFSRAAVTRFVARVARKLDRSPADASVTLGAASLATVPGRVGRKLDRPALEASVLAALGNASAPRRLKASVSTVRPKVSTRALARKYPAVVTVDRANFRLRLWKNLRLVKTYPIAVGMAGLETPAGVYHVQNKQVDPSWHVPNSAWAGSLAGQVIPPGPADPIKARWLGIFDGAGIHGTDNVGSLGSAASHGCIRMAIPDVIELYPQVPVGAPVYIA
ncbi:MAG: ErfK/YbiS/YcfS/YnhG family protein [Solirubrobacterales bacterium]|nr:ErfK/YbiS/YcfS/YnhG family protein [Solirubrobacterales bacterium]